jgi:hypothetical protein
LPRVEVAKKDFKDFDIERYSLTLKHLLKYLKTPQDDITYIDGKRPNGEPLRV